MLSNDILGGTTTGISHNARLALPVIIPIVVPHVDALMSLHPFVITHLPDRLVDPYHIPCFPRVQGRQAQPAVLFANTPASSIATFLDPR